jgi:Fe-S cluster assembly scaffold protein SufB
MKPLISNSENLFAWYDRVSAEAPLRPFPTTKQEAWRLTNLKTLRDANLKGRSSLRLVLFELDKDGVERRLATVPEGLIITEGESTFSDKTLNSDEFYEDIPKLFPQESVRIDVTQKYKSERPIVFRWKAEGVEAAESYSLAPLNVTWNIEAGVEFKFVKEVLASAPVLSVLREEFHLSQGSIVETVTLSGAEKGIHLESRAARLMKNARWTSLIIDFGGAYSRLALNCHLEGEGAEARTLGAVGLTGDQVSEHPTVLDHLSPHSTSMQLYKSALNGTSRAVINGRVVIRQDAQKVSSSQYNKNLLLSSGAYVHSKPELRVAADDVQAAHGATTGQLNPDELFYLQARGLSAAIAQELISGGFLQEVVEHLSSAPLRGWATARLQESLPVILEGAL